ETPALDCGRAVPGHARVAVGSARLFADVARVGRSRRAAARGRPDDRGALPWHARLAVRCRALLGALRIVAQRAGGCRGAGAARLPDRVPGLGGTAGRQVWG